MSGPTTLHPSNIVIGAGDAFIDVLDADGNTQGERFLGETSGMQLTVTEERTTVNSTSGPVAVKLSEAVISREYAAQVTVRDMSADNLALLLAGDASTEADAAAAVVDEEITVSPGLWYQLGRSATKPMGYLAVKSAPAPAVTSEDGNTTYDAGDDYSIDADTGRLYIVPGGEIEADTKVKVDYTPVEGKHERAQTAAEPRTVYAAVRYVEKPVLGRGRNVYIRRCTVGASGDLQLKDGQRQNEQQIVLALGIEEPGGEDKAVLIDGKAA